jgi:hypothetical protein
VATNENPRERIPGARSRFRFPQSYTDYAFIGPALVVLLVLLVGLYAIGDWFGGRQATNPGSGNQPPAVKTDTPPKNPSTAPQK